MDVYKFMYRIGPIGINNTYLSAYIVGLKYCVLNTQECLHLQELS